VKRPRHPQGPVDESNRLLALHMARIPNPPPVKPKTRPVPWGLLTMAAVTAAALGWAVYWTIIR
jgi:hypothetical protein